MRETGLGTKPRSRKTILIVDDHPVLRRGLAALIGSEPDLLVCAEAATGADAMAAVRENRPDLVIVDIKLGQVWSIQKFNQCRYRKLGQVEFLTWNQVRQKTT